MASSATAFYTNNASPSSPFTFLLLLITLFFRLLLISKNTARSHVFPFILFVRSFVRFFPFLSFYSNLRGSTRYFSYRSKVARHRSPRTPFALEIPFEVTRNLTRWFEKFRRLDDEPRETSSRLIFTNRTILRRMHFCLLVPSLPTYENSFTFSIRLVGITRRSKIYEEENVSKNRRTNETHRLVLPLDVPKKNDRSIGINTYLRDRCTNDVARNSVKITKFITSLRLYIPIISKKHGLRGSMSKTIYC